MDDVDSTPTLLSVPRGRLAAREVAATTRLTVLVALGYAAGAGAAFVAFRASTVGAVLFMPAGVTVAALILSPSRRWPWVLGAAGLVELTVDLWQGTGVTATLGFVLANLVEPLVGATLLRQAVPQLDLSRRRHLTAFVGWAVVAGPAVGALIGGTTGVLGQGVSWSHAYLTFWAGDALGVLTVGGVILTWRAGGGRADRQLRRGRPTVQWQLIAAGLAAAATLAGFWQQRLPLAYLPVLVLLGIAYRLGSVGIPVAGLAVAVTANAMSAAGHGAWITLSLDPASARVNLQVFVAVTVLSAWLLADQVDDRERTLAASRQEVALRQRIQTLQVLTAGLAAAPTFESIGATVIERGIALVADRGVVAIELVDASAIRTWTTADFPDDVAAEFRYLPVDSPVPAAAVIRTGQRVVAHSLGEIATAFPHTLDSYRLTGTNSTFIVPIMAEHRAIGSLSFGYDHPGPIHPELLSFAETVATLTAQALARARLYESERSAAHQLQQALLPTPTLQLPGVVSAVAYRPADGSHDVGGDWYDVFPVPGQRVAIVVGDAVGHDLRAAAAMGRLQTSLRMVASQGFGPAEVLTQLDQAATAIPGGLHATVGYAEYDPAAGTLRYACAGHPPALLVSGGQADYLGEGRSEPLGAAARPRSEAVVDVPDGAMLVWYSDGLIERRGESLDAGLDRLAALARTITGTDSRTWIDAITTLLSSQQDAWDDAVIVCAHLTRT